MVKKKRTECIKCNEPLEPYCGDGCPSSYCPTCAEEQQKELTKIARQIRNIKKKLPRLQDEFLKGNGNIKKFYDEVLLLEKKIEIQEGMKIKKL